MIRDGPEYIKSGNMPMMVESLRMIKAAQRKTSTDKGLKANPAFALHLRALPPIDPTILGRPRATESSKKNTDEHKSPILSCT